MYKVNPKILQTPLSEGKILMLEPQQGLYFELNEVSALIYQCIQQGMDSEATVEKIVGAFSIDHETAETDRLAFIQQLYENNILID